MCKYVLFVCGVCVVLMLFVCGVCGVGAVCVDCECCLCGICMCCVYIESVMCCVVHLTVPSRNVGVAPTTQFLDKLLKGRTVWDHRRTEIQPLHSDRVSSRW